MHYLYFRYRLAYCDLKAKIQYSNWFMYITWKWNRWNMKKILFTIVILFLANVVNAQTPGAISTSKLGWDQDATTLVEAQGLTYKYYADGATTGVQFVVVSCNGATSPFQCETAFPAFTPGTHTVVLTANNLAGESPKSTPPFGFTFVVTPSTPKNIKIK